MSLLAQIKADQLQARKDRQLVNISLLTTLLGDINTAAINGKAELSDVEIYKIITKFQKGIDETVRIVGSISEIQQQELDILNSYLPGKFTTEELTAKIQEIITEATETTMQPPHLGYIMKELKNNYDSLYDGRIATGIIKQLLREV